MTRLFRASLLTAGLGITGTTKKGNTMSEDKGRQVPYHRSGGGLRAPSALPPLPNYTKLSLRDGEPCSHPGCLNHVSHPCEGCGRVAGKCVVYPLADDWDGSHL